MKTLNWLLTTIAVGSLATACTVTTGPGDDDDGTGSGGGTTTGSGTGVVGSTTGVGGGQIDSCYLPDNNVIAPGQEAQTGKGDCTSAQIDDFFTACFNGGECSDFQDATANVECVGCILGTGGNHYAPLIAGNDIGDATQYYVNVYACESMARGADQCADDTSQFTHCVNTSCDTCPAGSTAEQLSPEEIACREDAQTNICSQITVAAECQQILDDVDTSLTNLSPECAGSSFEALYKSAANYICGSGVN